MTTTEINGEDIKTEKHLTTPTSNQNLNPSASYSTSLPDDDGGEPQDLLMGEYMKRPRRTIIRILDEVDDTLIPDPEDMARKKRRSHSRKRSRSRTRSRSRRHRSRRRH